MIQVLVAVVLVLVAVSVAAMLRRRRPDPPVQTSWSAPSQLDRADFERPEAPWLVAVFSSATCQTCADVVAKAKVMAASDVVVQEVEYGHDKELHGRYRIDAVPIVLLADATGVVRRSFIGPVTAQDLWAAFAEARQESDER